MIGPGFAAGVGAQTIKIMAVVLGIVVLIAAFIGYEIAVWRECLAGHPWWYCLRIIGQS